MLIMVSCRNIKFALLFYSLLVNIKTRQSQNPSILIIIIILLTNFGSFQLKILSLYYIDTFHYECVAQLICIIFVKNIRAFLYLTLHMKSFIVTIVNTFAFPCSFSNIFLKIFPENRIINQIYDTLCYCIPRIL